jgi:hypothetical protein
MTYGPVTRQTQHWMVAQTILQRLSCLERAAAMGETRLNLPAAERAELLAARMCNETAVLIAQTMLRVQPAANDCGGQPCKA